MRFHIHKWVFVEHLRIFCGYGGYCAVYTCKKCGKDKYEDLPERR